MEKLAAGDEQYKQKYYSMAWDSYSDAISMSPTTAAYYRSRSNCSMMMHHHKAALKDIQKAIRFGDDSAECYDRMVNCHLCLGDIDRAGVAIEKLDPNNENRQRYKEQCERLRFLGENTMQSFQQSNFQGAGVCYFSSFISKYIT